ncbi:Fc receptor-like A [Lates calcarifer]|uniref:Fc receptor-like A n=1 Tax=Lates calcarifer TaxID=8187 RepID=A0AAJ8B3R7_LATCA|nr:Fc receptor-like A [Lates calcarifer]
MSYLSSSDSGGYWCEDRADQINITVSGVPVILEIPALPVMTGSDVTLRCRDKAHVRFKAFFFRDGVLLGSGPDGELTLSKVQQSHEGLYWCSTDLHGSSPQSRLRVRAPPPPPPPPPPSTTTPYTSPPLPPPPPSSLLVQVVAALGSVVLLVLVVVLFLWRRRGSSHSSPTDEVVYTEVTSRQSANKRGPDEVLYTQVVIRPQRTTGVRTGS